MLLLQVLGRTGCLQDGRIHDGATLHNAAVLSPHRTRAGTTSFPINAYNLDGVGFRIQHSLQFHLLSNETAR
jgi:hypothetical protein